jgi:predicted GNAT family N-acyltransferase
MNKLTFKIITHGSTEYTKSVSLREKILRHSHGLSFSSEDLAHEKDCIHIVGFIDNELCAAAVLALEGKICKMQRVAVKADIQGKGIGSEMIKFCEATALTNGFNEIYCHARNTAVPFYLRNHYIGEGDYFNEDSIPHLKMRKILLK